MRTITFEDFIYRHSKLVLVAEIFAIFVLVLILSFHFNMVKADASTYNEKYYKCITIDYGTTLIDIAEEYVSEEYSSIEEYVLEVKQINGLEDSKLISGATLVIPYYAAPM